MTEGTKPNKKRHLFGEWCIILGVDILFGLLGYDTLYLLGFLAGVWGGRYFEAER